MANASCFFQDSFSFFIVEPELSSSFPFEHKDSHLTLVHPVVQEIQIDGTLLVVGSRLIAFGWSWRLVVEKLHQSLHIVITSLFFALSRRVPDLFSYLHQLLQSLCLINFKQSFPTRTPGLSLGERLIPLRVWCPSQSSRTFSPRCWWRWCNIRIVLNS